MGVFSSAAVKMALVYFSKLVFNQKYAQVIVSVKYLVEEKCAKQLSLSYYNIYAGMCLKICREHVCILSCD